MSEKTQAVLCPYCGRLQRKRDRCDECGGLLDDHSRTATQIAMGPWYVRNPGKPFHPGCSFAVLRKQIKAGKVTENSVLRGPTTHQFWQVAKRVPGVAHLVGSCHNCHKHVKDRTVTSCPHCGAAFNEPSERNELGLRYRTREAADAAKADLDRHHREVAEKAKRKREKKSAPAAPAPPESRGEDLLEEVLGGASVSAPAPAAQEPEAHEPEPEVAVDQVSPTAAVPKKTDYTMALLVALNVAVLAALGWFFFLRK